MSLISNSQVEQIKKVFHHLGHKRKNFSVRITTLSPKKNSSKKKTKFLRIRMLKRSYYQKTSNEGKPHNTVLNISSLGQNATKDDKTDSSIIDINTSDHVNNEEIKVNEEQRPKESEERRKEHQALLDKILEGNPNINIIGKKGHYLMRIKVNKRNIAEKYATLEDARKARNQYLLLSMENDPKFYIHLMRRNTISIHNKIKKN